MCCIGVISKDVELINQLIKNNRIIIISRENIQKYKNVEFNILVIEDKIISNEDLELLCQHSKFILIQDNINLNMRLENKINIITFGFNHKSTVTISSISNEKMIICIQRQINTLNNHKIEPQEFSIPIVDLNNINVNIIKKIIEQILEK